MTVAIPPSVDLAKQPALSGDVVDLDALLARKVPTDCPKCGRSPQRHALYYLPNAREFVGWRRCEAIDDLERRLGKPEEPA